MYLLLVFAPIHARACIQPTNIYIKVENWKLKIENYSGLMRLPNFSCITRENTPLEALNFPNNPKNPKNPKNLKTPKNPRARLIAKSATVGGKWQAADNCRLPADDGVSTIKSKPSPILQFFHHLSRGILKKLKKILKNFKNCVALLKKMYIFAIGNKI